MIWKMYYHAVLHIIEMFLRASIAFIYLNTKDIYMKDAETFKCTFIFGIILLLSNDIFH